METGLFIMDAALWQLLMAGNRINVPLRFMDDAGGAVPARQSLVVPLEEEFSLSRLYLSRWGTSAIPALDWRAFIFRFRFLVLCFSDLISISAIFSVINRELSCKLRQNSESFFFLDIV